MNFIIDQHAILFYRRIMNISNNILHALLRTKQCCVVSLLAKYSILYLVITAADKIMYLEQFVTKSVRAGHISVSI